MSTRPALDVLQLEQHGCKGQFNAAACGLARTSVGMLGPSILSLLVLQLSESAGCGKIKSFCGRCLNVGADDDERADRHVFGRCSRCEQ